MRALVVCADDFGCSAPVSEGIATLIGLGRVTATSAMVCAPRWPLDALTLRPLADRADVGLHLDWTSDFAQAAGHGAPLPTVMARAAAGAWSAPALRGEIERQLDAFERHWQAAPDHIDGHQHVHQMNGIRQALLAVLARRYPTQRPWVRVSATPPGLGSVKSVAVSAWGAAPLRRALAQARWPAAPWLVGMYNFSADPTAYAPHMARWLEQAPSGSLLMCHPAHAPDRTDPIGAARLHEFNHLASAQFSAALQAADVALVRGRALFITP